MTPLFKPYMPELPMMDSILHSGSLAYGNYTKQFEECLREYFGTPNLIVTNSYSSAVAVTLAALGIEKGEIVASPMACLVSSQSFLTNGMKMKWADIDAKSGTLKPDGIKKYVSKETKAIVHNHFCGYPGYIDEINAIGQELGIPVIDDGIECFGSEYKGKKIGSCNTDVTIFSLSAVRIPNCIEGGIVIFKDAAIFKKSLVIRDCGIERNKFRDEMGEIRKECDICLKGYSAMMSEVNGYIGLQQMQDIDTILRAQRRQADRWKNELEGGKNISVMERTEINPNYWVFGILASDKKGCIQKYREKGWYASGVHLNNNEYSVFGKEQTLPGVLEFYNHFVALPCGWWVEKKEEKCREKF